MPLHIDYRPKDFDEVIGNRGVIESHKAIFQRQSDYPHAVLYVGSSGAGKTTMARIYASKLGCHLRDLKEINAANNRGIDTARDIQKTMNFSPFNGSIKCYLIDEIGATNKDFQTAMLKALEDAPPHVYFLMATTDPQNLLPTLKNRCSIFEMSLLSHHEISSLIKGVLKKENCEDIPDEVVSEIAVVSDGCPRQALVILDQIIDLPIESMMSAIGDSRVTERSVKDLCRSLLNKDPWSKIAAILSAIDMAKAEDVRRQVLGYMAAVLLSGKDNPQAAIIIEFFKEPTYNSGKAGLVYASYQSSI
jgi:DNA polymerase-3 subunit gamma/tau